LQGAFLTLRVPMPMAVGMCWCRCTERKVGVLHLHLSS